MSAGSQSLVLESFPGGVVAVTGGMGSGKSSVAELLATLAEALFLSADIICRELLEPEAAGWVALRQSFGQRFLLQDGRLDRPGLRQALFADCELRRAIDALLHPLARGEIARRLAVSGAASGQQRVVVEVPLLYEAGWQEDFSRVVVVYADPSVCLARLAQRDRLSPAGASQATGVQLPLASKVLWADHVIDNSGCWWNTWLQVRRLRCLLWQPSERQNGDVL